MNRQVSGWVCGCKRGRWVDLPIKSYISESSLVNFENSILRNKIIITTIL